MKRLFFLFTILAAFGFGVYAQQPLTQFSLVEVLDGDIGVSLRSDNELARLLKNIGFTVSTFKRPANTDEMLAFTSLDATRRSSAGKTHLTVRRGEDIYCFIDFATQAEATKFVESMKKSGYRQQGSLYSHPSNSMAKIYVRVNGRRVKIISPFESLPSNF